MDDKFSMLRSAVRNYLAQSEASVGDELLEFRNAASVLTISQLLRDHDSAKQALETLTNGGSLGSLSADEVHLITALRSLEEAGRRTVLIAANAAASVYSKTSHKQRAEVVELRPKK